MSNYNRSIQMRNLRPLLFFGLMLSAAGVLGQRKLQNQPKYDRKLVHFGFCVGLNYYDFHIQEIENLSGLDGYYNIRSSVSPGYSIGIISSLRLADYWDLRFIPTFAATERQLFFDIEDPQTGERKEEERRIESSFIEFPFELKWKSERINNYRMYVLGGFKYNIDLASKEDVVDDRIFKLRSRDMMYEFGFGIDIYFEFFKFSPQIKGSWGIADLMVRDGTFLVDGIDRLESRCILINFTFE